MLFQRRFHERIRSGEIRCTFRAGATTSSATCASSKSLDLTVRLEVGYRLTPKAEALLAGPLQRRGGGAVGNL
jgi:hypothetical protein